MAHTSFTGSVASDTRPEIRELLFKPDHPRGIDRYIDYFGGTEESADADEDTESAVVLERPA
jgi:hypothetical protein